MLIIKIFFYVWLFNLISLYTPQQVIIILINNNLTVYLF